MSPNHTLALDLGTKTGFAYYSRPGELTQAGTWTLETPKGMQYAKKLRMDRRLDPRVMALINNLETLRRKSSIDNIVFEDVRFATSQAQAHLWGSFRGAVWAFAHLNGIQVDCLETGKLKKFATGSGSADKLFMMRSLCERWPQSFRFEKDLVRYISAGIMLDDNAVDAMHLLDWAINPITIE